MDHSITPHSMEVALKILLCLTAYNSHICTMLLQNMFSVRSDATERVFHPLSAFLFAFFCTEIINERIIKEVVSDYTFHFQITENVSIKSLNRSLH
jgi:hypothetical protein